jgi:hypothetical protein
MEYFCFRSRMFYITVDFMFIKYNVYSVLFPIRNELISRGLIAHINL